MALSAVSECEPLRAGSWRLSLRDVSASKKLSDVSDLLTASIIRAIIIAVMSTWNRSEHICRDSLVNKYWALSLCFTFPLNEIVITFLAKISLEHRRIPGTWIHISVQSGHHYSGAGLLNYCHLISPLKGHCSFSITFLRRADRHDT
jgi:hypothetical protein